MAGLGRSLCRHVQGLATQVTKENIDMLQNEHESFCWAKRAGVIAVALILGILIFGVYGAPSASAAPNKDKEFTQVYQHTYDEVFQAIQETVERKGYFVTDKDKDKGTVTATSSNRKVDFYIHVETLNTKPETRVTVIPKLKGSKLFGSGLAQDSEDFLKELQKVLSTYH